MKKLNKLMAVLLSLTLCLGMVAPAFAATLDDLQDAINGTADTNSDNVIGDTGYHGYGANDKGTNDESKGWDIWAKDTDDGRDVQLKGDVGPAPEPAPAPAEKPESDTITVDKTVNLDLNDHNITGNGEDTVIEVQQGGDLTITGGEGETGNTISNNPSNAETPAEGANGIDVEGKLELDGVAIKDTDTAVNVEEGGTAQIEDSTITGNNTGVAFVDDGSVTFVEDQNVVNGNTTNISGTGKVNFELNGTAYKVDAKTAGTLLKPDSIDSHGTDWILAKNGDGAYTVVYTGQGSGSQKWLTQKLVTDTLQAAGAGGKEISGFVVSGDVTSIGADAFRNCTWLEEVQLKGNITSIGSNAFNGCFKLKTIDLPESVTFIDQGAFLKCTGLKSVQLGGKVKTIGAGAFQACSSLKTVNIPETVETIGRSAFDGCKELTKIELPNTLKTLGKMAFQNCANLKTVTIPADVATIGESAFNSCTGLKEIKFAESSTCTTIGKSAFEGCTGLTGTVVIPESVTVIGYTAFNKCSNIAEVQIKGNVETIGEGAFQNCSRLETVNIPKTVTKIGQGAFGGCKELTKIELPDALQELGYKAFFRCAKLETVTIPAGIKEIGNTTFGDCVNLKEVIFPEDSQCAKIDAEAFAGCGSLRSFTVPKNVTTISNGTFYRCTNLETIQIEGNVTSIGKEVFVYCVNLKSINIPDTVTAIGQDAFHGCRSLNTITVPACVTDLGEDAFLYSGIKSIFVRSIADNDGAGTASLLAEKVNTNIFIKADEANLDFYRGKVSADFGHNVADEDVKLEDGSVNLTNVSGAINTGKETVAVPAGARVSIDTDGNIEVRAPITVDGVFYPNGASIDPNGNATPLPAPPVDDDYVDPTANETEINDPAVPLAAGPVTRAQFIDYLWRHEGEPEGADCTFADVPADHEYVLALGWAQANGIAAADADGNFQPDELVTVAAVREFLGSFASVFGTNAVDVADLTTLTGADDEAVLNCDQVLAQFFGEEYVPVDDENIEIAA